MARGAPGLAAGNVCIRRFARTFDGLVEAAGATRYKCQARVTERLTTSVTFRITAKAECDDVGKVLALGLVLRARVRHDSPRRWVCPLRGASRSHRCDLGA